jgi:hypothetical protein
MKYSHYITGMLIACICLSCSYSKMFTTGYYRENEDRFLSLKSRFKELHEKHPFSVEIRDKDFQHIGLEIITDSIKYIYSFGISEARLTDTLLKYGFDAPATLTLISDMQNVHCTWITNLDYYENREKKFLVFLSVRHRKLKAFLRPEKYFTLAFFDRRQHFDQKGRLLDNETGKELHKLNGGLFRKINDRVCYSLSADFR